MGLLQGDEGKFWAHFNHTASDFSASAGVFVPFESVGN